jgi:predicted methyltransferase
MKPVVCAVLALSLWSAAHADTPRPDEALRQAIAAPERTPAFVARDVWRHPYETLSFFGLKANSTVVEISPGGGWYTEILAPYLRDHGQLILAADDPAAPTPEMARNLERLRAKLAASPQRYDKVLLRAFAPPDRLDYASPGTVDLVLTFRNVHNWMQDGEGGVRAVFDSAYRSLKSGGVLGVVEHRLPAGRTPDANSKGYVPQAFVIRVAQASGFRLEASSEINANPRDTASHLGGVWALPPSYANKDADRASFEAIGESDRMTLRFVKP